MAGLYIVDTKDWDENPIGVEQYPVTPGAPTYPQLNSPAANYRLRAFSGGCGCGCGMGADEQKAVVTPLLIVGGLLAAWFMLR